MYNKSTLHFTKSGNSLIFVKWQTSHVQKCKDVIYFPKFSWLDKFSLFVTLGEKSFLFKCFSPKFRKFPTISNKLFNSKILFVHSSFWSNHDSSEIHRDSQHFFCQKDASFSNTNYFTQCTFFPQILITLKFRLISHHSWPKRALHKLNLLRNIFLSLVSSDFPSHHIALLAC